MGTLIRELTQAGIYKRSQGRITRQVTFAALAIGIALGLWRMHDILKNWNPEFRIGLQQTAAENAGLVTLQREDPGDQRYSLIVILNDGKEVERHTIPDQWKIRVEDRKEIKAGVTLMDWDNNALILGMLSYGLPGVLLAGGVWFAYRLVNVPGVADFLIAVEAEVNKVSWPSRNELFRASVVVLITIFVLAFVLALFDVFWRFVFTHVLRLF